MNEVKIPKPAEAHCATCSCAPGMTPAVRFDTTPAERDEVVRDHLIRMGWTPPAEAQAQGGGEVAEVRETQCSCHPQTCCCCGDYMLWVHGVGLTTGYRDNMQTIADAINAKAAPPSAPVGWVLVPMDPTEAMIEAGNAAAHAGGCDLWQLKREVMNAWQAMLATAPNCPARTAPPSAPVGVDRHVKGLAKGAVNLLRRYAEEKPKEWCSLLDDALGCVEDIERALAQQPAAVDGCAERCKRRHPHTKLTLTRDAAPDTGWHWSVTLPDGHLYDVSQGRMTFEQVRADLIGRGLAAFDAADTAWRAALAAQPGGSDNE